MCWSIVFEAHLRSRHGSNKRRQRFLGLPGVVAMELLIGCQESEEVDHFQKFLRTFSLVWPDAAGFAQAWAD
jgi:hypothetical protein